MPRPSDSSSAPTLRQIDIDDPMILRITRFNFLGRGPHLSAKTVPNSFWHKCHRGKLSNSYTDTARLRTSSLTFRFLLLSSRKGKVTERCWGSETGPPGRQRAANQKLMHVSSAFCLEWRQCICSRRSWSPVTVRLFGGLYSFWCHSVRCKCLGVARRAGSDTPRPIM
jgi:hypothetical protein